MSFTTNDSSEYRWNKNYKIQVSDFQLDANMKKGQLASISTGIVFTRNWAGTYTFRSYAVSDRKQSRISPKAYNGYRLQEVLAHEQLHFDISEYVSRLLNSRLRHIKDPIIADKLYNEYLNMLGDIQTIYDAQTEHSCDTLWQAKWQKNMDRLLSMDDPDNSWKMYP
jgi:hypothetical protein